MATGPFQWGAAGQALSPQEVERRRMMSAAAAQRGTDTSPVNSIWEGLARLTDAFGGYRGNMLATQAEETGRGEAKSIIDALLGGGGSTVSMSSSGAREPRVGGIVADGGVGYAGQVPSAPVGGVAERVRLGLIERGLPEHVADGFLLNFQDESGLNPGINEIAPTVAGSRGGFGLAQWTGPRRVGLEQAAAQRGVDPSDVDLQLDYLMGELQGAESGAARSILSAPDAGSAAAAVARDFLRPAPEHLARRVANYTGGNATLSTSGGGSSGASPVMAALLQASANPWVQQEYGPVLQALMGQEGQRQQFAMQQQAQASDPLRQLQIQQAQVDLARSQQPQAPELVRAGDGTLYNPATGEWLQAPQGPQDAFNPDRYRVVGNSLYDLAADGGPTAVGTGDGQTEVIYGPDGQPIIQRGPASSTRPFTEGQSKDVVYSTRARGALEAFEPIADVMASRVNRMADAVPFGLGREFQSEEYQVAQNAANEFAQAVLRKDTGAAMTKEETQLVDQLYIPQPGDGEAVLGQKKQARRRAIAAMEAGMSPAQMFAQEQALRASGSIPAPPAPPAPPIGDMPAQPAIPQAPAAPSPNERPISTPEEYNALPSGTVFIAPDGSRRRKP